MRLLPVLTICLLATSPVLAAEGLRAPKVAAPTARTGCVAVPAAEARTDAAVPAASWRRVTLVCGTAPDQGCGGSGAPSLRFRANGRPLPDWRAGCSFRADGSHAGQPLG